MPEYNTPDAAAPKRKPMEDEALQAEMKRLVSEAETFIDDELSPLRAKATEYYNAQPFGNEIEGRSKVVVPELRDAVTTFLPSFMRAFYGADKIVEFAPIGPEDVAQAEQETDYINEIVMSQDNPGFLNTLYWAKDGLIRTTGVAKWAWLSEPPTHHRVDNMTWEQLEDLLSDDEVTLVGAVEKSVAPLGVPMTVYDVEFRVTNEEGYAWWGILPPEELIWNRDARSLDEALFVAHRSQRTTTELLEMGVALEDIVEHGGVTLTIPENEEAFVRNPLAVDTPQGGADPRPDRDPDEVGANDLHDYIESYPKIDVDGDGKAELRKICMLGPDRYVVMNIPAEERPFALYIPDPEPHTVLGLSFYDYVGDLQKISSMIFRASLDGLSANLNPRFEVVTDKVNIADVLNNELGAVVRVKEPNSIRAISLPFDAVSSMAMLDRVDSYKENRLGTSKAAAGLNPDALQSSTKAAVAATVTAAQQRIEMFVRVFAETGYKDLMRGLRRLVIKHQPRKRMVRLRGTYVEVNPRTWDSDRDVHVNVTLGLGFADEKLAVLQGIGEWQLRMLETFGPSNPIVGAEHVKATMARIVKLKGYPRKEEFMFPDGYQPPPPPPAPPDPAMMVAQSQMQKDQAETERRQAEFQLKQMEAQAGDARAEREAARKDAEMQASAGREAQKLANEAEAQRRKDDLERDKLQADIWLRTREMELKYQTQIDTANLEAELDRDRERMKLDTAERTARIAADGKVAEAAATPKPEPAKKESAPKPAAPPNITVNVSGDKRPRKLKATKGTDGSMTIEAEDGE